MTPGRLALHEDALVGVTAHASYVLGSYDPAGHYIPSPPATHELDLGEDLFGSLRVLEHGQVTLLVPFVETWRSVPTRSGFGGGVGDVNLSARYDFIHAGQSKTWPGIALLLGITAPSGRPPERARSALATDATGIGTWQFTAGVALEQTFGRVVVNLSGFVSQRLQRSIQGVRELLGVQYTVLGAVGYAFRNEVAIALSFGYTGETNAYIEGRLTPGTGRGLPTLSAFVSSPLAEEWRIQGGLFTNVPLGLGRNQPGGFGMTVTVVRLWI